MTKAEKVDLLNDPYYKPAGPPASDKRPMAGTQLTPTTPDVPSTVTTPQGLYLDNIHNHTLSVRLR
jgi:hypothetical protein